MLHRVLRVISAEYAILKSNPPCLAIDAWGETPTLGWKSGQLLPWYYVVPPKDGIQDFDFVAESPSGPSGSALGRVNTQYMQTIPDWMNGFRIHTAYNEPYEVRFDKDKNILKSNPANDEHFVEAGTAEFGFSPGETHDAKRVTTKDLFHCEMNVPGIEKLLFLRSLTKAEIKKLFDQNTIDMMLKYPNGQNFHGKYQFIQIKKGRLLHRIEWQKSSAIPKPILKYYDMLKNLT